MAVKIVGDVEAYFEEVQGDCRFELRGPIASTYLALSEVFPTLIDSPMQDPMSPYADVHTFGPPSPFPTGAILWVQLEGGIVGFVDELARRLSDVGWSGEVHLYRRGGPDWSDSNTLTDSRLALLYHIRENQGPAAIAPISKWMSGWADRFLFIVPGAESSITDSGIFLELSAAVALGPDREINQEGRGSSGYVTNDSGYDRNGLVTLQSELPVHRQVDDLRELVVSLAGYVDYAAILRFDSGESERVARSVWIHLSDSVDYRESIPVPAGIQLVREELVEGIHIPEGWSVLPTASEMTLVECSAYDYDGPFPPEHIYGSPLRPKAIAPTLAEFRDFRLGISHW